MPGSPRPPEADRDQLRRWLKDGSIRIGPDKDGAIVAEREIEPPVVISTGGAPRRELRETILHGLA